MESPQIISLWPGGAPGSEDWTQVEEEREVQGGLKVVRNVTEPSLTAYLPHPDTANGCAAIVCPGGAYHLLAIDMEGTDVALWLAQRGITAFVLKYRLIKTGDDFPEVVNQHLEDRDTMGKLLEPLWPLLIADGQQAVRLVRSNNARWGIQKDRIGMIGFSAGGTVTANVALIHDADSRPDFAAAIYSADREQVPVPADAPPLFVLCADDDDMASPISIKLYQDWRAAGHPVSLHIYSKGGHGFGTRDLGLPTDGWIEVLYDFLFAQGLIAQP